MSRPILANGIEMLSMLSTFSTHFRSDRPRLPVKSKTLTQRATPGPAPVPDVRRVRSPEEDRDRMAEEVRARLRARPLPILPSKYFYDDRGGALFDEITRL